jgi:uncharacterized protein
VTTDCKSCTCADRSSEAGPVALTLAQPAPRGAPWYHVIDGDRPQALLVESSALFEISPPLASALTAGDPHAQALLANYRPAPTARDLPADLPSPTAISLNVAQSCNLTCSYCYADEGRFGGAARRMSPDTARAAIDELLDGARAGDSVLVGFIGGEPLLNRPVVHDSVAYTRDRAAARGIHARFSITTNATLLSATDRDLLRSNAFAVTVSIDGGRGRHDRHRRRRDGSGSWENILDHVGDLLANPGSARVSARATITRDDLDVAGVVSEVLAAGFTEVGVSPVRTGPDPALVVSGSDWATYLAGMIEAAQHETSRLNRDGAHQGWRFANFGNALTEIHRGTARPLPCGAGYGYLSVDVDGRYATCHRTVGDPRFDLGVIGSRSDDARAAFLSARLVDTQQPCQNCWARYLCGGGCHAEVTHAGRDGCDMIRGWLDFCLAAYPELCARFPTLFGADQPAERSPADG